MGGLGQVSREDSVAERQRHRCSFGFLDRSELQSVYLRFQRDNSREQAVEFVVAEACERELGEVEHVGIDASKK